MPSGHPWQRDNHQGGKTSTVEIKSNEGGGDGLSFINVYVSKPSEFYQMSLQKKRTKQCVFLLF